jgi:spore maturation protein SpmB
MNIEARRIAAIEAAGLFDWIATVLTWVLICITYPMYCPV